MLSKATETSPTARRKLMAKADKLANNVLILPIEEKKSKYTD